TTIGEFDTGSSIRPLIDIGTSWVKWSPLLEGCGAMHHRCAPPAYSRGGWKGLRRNSQPNYRPSFRTAWMDRACLGPQPAREALCRDRTPAAPAYAARASRTRV